MVSTAQPHAAAGEARPIASARFPNRAESIRKPVEKLGAPAQLRVCYEAGPTGYVMYNERFVGR